MLAEPSNSAHVVEVKEAKVATDLLWPSRLLLLALNALPLAHVASVALAVLHGNILAALAVLYLAPPLVARLLLISGHFQSTKIPVGSAGFFRWWALFQLQVIFCRLPALEEILRLIPGIYSLWLRLWGARVGRLTYWSPATFISDRSFLKIGDDVVFGAGVRLIPHLIQRSESGKLELCLAKIEIGDRVVVGGFSILSAGTIIHSDQTTRAALLSPPFTIWEHGKRVRDE